MKRFLAILLSLLLVVCQPVAVFAAAGEDLTVAAGKVTIDTEDSYDNITVTGGILEILGCKLQLTSAGSKNIYISGGEVVVLDGRLTGNMSTVLNISGGHVRGSGTYMEQPVRVASGEVNITGGIVEIPDILGFDITINGDTAVIVEKIANFGNYTDIPYTFSKGLLIVGNTGTVKGEVTLPGAVTVKSGVTLDFVSGAKITNPELLTIEEGATILFDGLSCTAHTINPDTGKCYYCGAVCEHSFGEDCICSICGAISPDVAATITAGDTTRYSADLQTAINHAETMENATVQLLRNISQDTTIRQGTFTLDLNGCTLTGSMNIQGGLVDLKSSRPGAVVDTGTDMFGIDVSAGKLTIYENVTVTGKPSGSGAVGTLRIYGATAQAELKGGTVISTSNNPAVEVHENGTFTLSSGTANGSREEAICANSATLILNGGTVHGNHDALSLAFSAHLVLTGTELINDANYYAIELFGSNGITPAVDMTGVTSANYSVEVLGSSDPIPVENLQYDPQRLIAYASQKVENNTYTPQTIITFSCNSHLWDSTGLCSMCDAQAMASVTLSGTTAYYLDLQEAIDAAEAGTADAPACLTVLNDIDMFGSHGNLNVESGVMRIDLNGHALMSQTGSILDIGAMDAPSDARVTITDSSEEQTGKIFANGYGMGIRCFGGTLILESGSIRVEDDDKLLGTGIRVMDGQLIMNGGYIYAQTNATRSPAKGVDLEGGSVTINGGKVVSTLAVCAEGGDVTVTGDAILTGSQYAIECQGNLTVNGGIITGTTGDIWHNAESGTFVLGFDGDTGIGATFPDGISISGGTLKAVLAEGAAYWQSGKQLSPDEDATVITGGDVTVGPECDHSGNTNTVWTPQGFANHSLICSVCGYYAVTESHNMDHGTGICKVCDYQSYCAVTLDGNTTYGPDHTPVLDLLAEATDTSIVEIKLYTDWIGIYSSKTLSIHRGIVTLDLNGCTMDTRIVLKEAQLTIVDTAEVKGTILNDGGAMAEIYGGKLIIDASTDYWGQAEGHDAWRILKGSASDSKTFTIGSTGTEDIVLPQGAVALDNTVGTHWKETNVLSDEIDHICLHNHADDTGDGKCDLCGKLLGIIRLAGEHRWNTAIKVADEMKANLNIEKFDAIIIASGNDFADALAGSYLSTVKNAPILLAWGQGGAFEFLDTDNIEYIKNNLAEDGIVYILGGEKAVPGLYEEALKDFTVKRLGGADRFETNLLILEEAGIDDGSEILVCTATNFADSLSASATGKPILLVFNNLTELLGKQPEFLAGLKDCTFTVIGGENAVSAKLAEAIGEYGKVERLAGTNRFETSVMVAEKYFENPESAVLAYALNYPDGLCGGSLAYSLKAPLILTMTGYEAAAVEYAKTTGIKTGLVLGGDTLISDASVRTIFAMDGDAEIVVK